MTAPASPNDGAGDRIILSIDAMGGDAGPRPVVAGMAKSADKNPRIRYILHGPRAELAPMVKRHRSLQGRVELRESASVVRMDDRPSHVVRHGNGTSMWSAVEAVRSGDATVAVSCGNTGALMALSMIRLKRLPGVNRPAIAVLWPNRKAKHFNVMLDVGADVRADADDLLRYAVMGAAYAHAGLGIELPRIGLLNVGTEDHKGRPELHEAHEMMQALAERGALDYVGFVEGGDIPGSAADVIVTDGFTGNIAIKTAEGTASLIGDLLREAFRYTPMSRLASVMAYPSLRRLKRRIDPRRVNGGVFLGLNGTVVKSHGSADATGVSAAIKLAANLAERRFHDTLAERLAAAAAAPMLSPGHKGRA